MSSIVKNEFNDTLEHLYDPTKLEIINGEVKLKSQALAGEILFANYDADGIDSSKRGGKTIIFEGVNNTGEVKDGVLKFATEDRSIGSYKNITDIVADFGFRARVESNILTTVQEREIVRLVSNIDSSQIRFYLQNQGAGISRVKREITNSAGAVVSDLIIATADLSVMPNYNIAFSNEGNIENRTYFNGVLVSTVTFTNFDFTDCDLIFGDDTSGVRTATSNYDNVQLWSSDAIQSDFDFPFPEATTYSLLEQEILTTVPYLMDQLIDFEVSIEQLNGSLIKSYFLRNVSRYWFNTVSSLWEVQSPILPKINQSNTQEEIKANASSFPLTKNIGAYIQVFNVMKSSPDGYTTPILDFFLLEFIFRFKLADIRLCTVYGGVFDNNGRPMSGVKIEVNSKDYFYNNSFIAGKGETLTNSDGLWSLTVVETTSDATSVDFKFTYTEDQKLVPKTFKRRIIPIESSKRFVDLLLEA